MRYYERRGLLRPPRSASGQRTYRDEDLRALAFLLMCRDGGLQLDEIAVLIGHPAPDGHRWQDIVQDCIAVVDEESARMQAAREYLNNAVRCPSDHPAVDCPYAQCWPTAKLSGAASEVSSNKRETLSSR